jgi:hypothetical protein
VINVDHLFGNHSYLAMVPDMGKRNLDGNATVAQYLKVSDTNIWLTEWLITQAEIRLIVKPRTMR